MQKKQAEMQAELKMEQFKAQIEAQKLMQEAELKKQLMDHEFQINMQLKQAEIDTHKAKETSKEDRKDERTRIQATQQSELIDQRKKDKPPTNFESSGNDVLGGGIGMEQFAPR